MLSAVCALFLIVAAGVASSPCSCNAGGIYQCNGPITERDVSAPDCSLMTTAWFLSESEELCALCDYLHTAYRHALVTVRSTTRCSCLARCCEQLSGCTCCQFLLPYSLRHLLMDWYFFRQRLSFYFASRSCSFVYFHFDIFFLSLSRFWLIFYTYCTYLRFRFLCLTFCQVQLAKQSNILSAAITHAGSDASDGSRAGRIVGWWVCDSMTFFENASFLVPWTMFFLFFLAHSKEFFCSYQCFVFGAANFCTNVESSGRSVSSLYWCCWAACCLRFAVAAAEQEPLILPDIA